MLFETIKAPNYMICLPLPVEFHLRPGEAVAENKSPSRREDDLG